MTLTKNLQTEENLRRMTQKAFPGCDMVSAVELTEGMCNAAYRIGLSDGRETIVKIAPAHHQNLLSNEVALMAAEVKAMQLIGAQTNIPVAQVYAYDTSRTLCSSDYFFMEVIPGKSMFTLRDEMTKPQREALHRRIGQITRAIGEVSNARFGFVGDETKQFDHLYDFVRLLLTNVLRDAAAKDVETGVAADDLLSVLQRHRSCFDEVTVPRLVHWDMWEGNIFVQDGRITGVIDWERAMWTEPFGDDRFRRHNRTAEMLLGYGQTTFTQAETIRILWYDVILYLTMMTEGRYRGYADDSQYQWTKPLFEASWQELQNIGKT